MYFLLDGVISDNISAVEYSIIVNDTEVINVMS